MLAAEFPHNIYEEKQQRTLNLWGTQFASAMFYKDKCQLKPHLFFIAPQNMK